MTYRHFLVLSLLLLGAGIAGAQDAPAAPTQAERERAAELNRQGVAAFKKARGDKEKLQKAAALLEESVALGGPTVHASTLNLAHVRAGLDEPEAALSLLRRVIEALPPTHVQAKEARVLLCQVRQKHPDPAAPKAAGERPPFKVGLDEGVEKPVRIAGLHPKYSKDMRMSGRQGDVVVDAIIDRDGCVTDMQTVSAASGDFERAMKSALKTWVFLPATLEGKPVAVYYHLETNFSLSR
jgi:TonB family protein